MVAGLADPRKGHVVSGNHERESVPCGWIRATRPEPLRSARAWMSATRAVDLSLQRSPGLPSFGTNHPVSRRRGLQGRPVWCPEGFSQPVGSVWRSGLTCIPANEVAFGLRCTRRTSLLELMTTRLAEVLRVEESLPLEVLVTMVRDTKIERSKDLVVNIRNAPVKPARAGYEIHYFYFTHSVVIQFIQSIYDASDPPCLEEPAFFRTIQ